MSSVWIFANVPRDDFQVMDRILDPIAEKYGIDGSGAGCSMSNTEFIRRDNSFNVDHMDEFTISRFRSECEKTLRDNGFKYVESNIE